MREILFRGKRLDNGEWLIGDLRQAPYFEGDTATYIMSPIPGSISSYINYPVDPSTVGQYTGLTDKNGKKIFEGDVVKIEHDDHAFDGTTIEHRTEQGVIAYDDFGMLGLVVEKYRGQNVWSDFFNVIALTDRIANWTFEVIGNRWDNPQLLEG